ncbi:MAG: hypothetical protein ACNS62_15600, partial [Candidatus Cyclobacteriaceae bacterium M3_2C_046]
GTFCLDAKSTQKNQDRKKMPSPFAAFTLKAILAWHTSLPAFSVGPALPGFSNNEMLPINHCSGKFNGGRSNRQKQIMSFLLGY